MVKIVGKNEDNSIDPAKIIQHLWNLRYIIIIFALFFSILAYTYATILPKQFQTYAVLEKPNVVDFQNLKQKTGTMISSKYSKAGVEFGETNFESFLDVGIYFDDFLNTIMSGSSFVKFLNANPEYRNIGKALSEENIREWLFIERLSDSKNKNIPLVKIIFHHSEDLNPKASAMLNGYVEFIKKLYVDENINSQINILVSQLDESEIVLSEILSEEKKSITHQLSLIEIEKESYLKKRTRTINNNIFAYKQALLTAKNSGIIDPPPPEKNFSLIEKNIAGLSFIKKDGLLFNLGTKILTTEIINLKEQLNNLEKTEEFNKIISRIENYQVLLTLPYVPQTGDNNNYLQTKQRINYLKAEIKYFLNINQVYKWDVILESAKKSKKIYPRKSLFAISGLFFGFIFSIIFMWFRSIIILK